MTTQPESKLSRQITKKLKAMPAVWCFKVHGSRYMPAGLPDIIGCANGQFFGIETKMPGKEDNTSPRQELMHERIREAGGRVLVATSVAEAVDFVRDVLKRGG